MALSTLLLLATAALTSAHFSIDYPPMRANSLSGQTNTSYSQWINPCASAPPILSLLVPSNTTSFQAPAYRAT
jgi:hypothetical protein